MTILIGFSGCRKLLLTTIKTYMYLSYLHHYDFALDASSDVASHSFGTKRWSWLNYTLTIYFIALISESCSQNCPEKLEAANNGNIRSSCPYHQLPHGRHNIIITPVHNFYSIRLATDTYFHSLKKLFTLQSFYLQQLLETCMQIEK